jgi:hypothetical protein
MPTAVIEKKTRLPIMLLVASGYFLGVLLPISRLGWFRKLGYWGGVVLPFLFLFYAGRDRLLSLIYDIKHGEPTRLTEADKWYERLLRFAALCAAVLICGSLGFAAWDFANNNLRWNLYISIGVGVFVFSFALSGVVGKQGLIDAPKWWETYFNRWFRSKDSRV